MYFSCCILLVVLHQVLSRKSEDAGLYSLLIIDMKFDFTLPKDYASSSPCTELDIPHGEKNIVVHCCCAPCSTAVLECLLFNKINPILFFFNTNIHPRKEYEKRRDELVHLCDLTGVEAVIGDYEPQKWFEAVKGLESCPERSARCEECFYMRLKATAYFAKERGINIFTTTLATSRWKNKQQVDAAGYRAQKECNGTLYWDKDWRKGGLVERRYKLVKEIAFYNQRYCGCVFSLEGALKQNKAQNKEDLMRSSLENNYS